MINNFYLTKADLFESDNKSGKELITTNNNSVLNTILGGANSKTNIVDTIKAIEKYNKDNKLDYDERIKYSLYVGDHFLTVAEGVFSPDEKTFICISYDATGAVSFEYGEGRDAKHLKNASAQLSTHYIPVNMIVDVIIKGYNDADTYFKNYEEIKPMSEETLTNMLTDIISELNSLCSASLFKTAIAKFNYAFKKNNLNQMDTYKFNQKAYNQYVVAFDKYLSLVKSIVSNYTESTKNFEIRSRNGMYFINCEYTETDDKKAKAIKFDKKVSELIKVLRDRNIKDGYIDKATLCERIFDITEINNYKSIINPVNVKQNSGETK